MAINNRAFLQQQLEALTIWHFINNYTIFEQEIKDLFCRNIPRISPENKQILYFLLAGIKCSAYIEYPSNSLKMDVVKYSKGEDFRSMSLSQIIKIHRQNHLIDFFEFNISSINRKSAEYPFTDCCIKLLNMRNKLAHQMSNLSFADTDIIELLSDKFIQSSSTIWLGNLDTALMNNETKCIYSNLVMLEKIKKTLCERGANL